MLPFFFNFDPPPPVNAWKLRQQRGELEETKGVCNKGKIQIYVLLFILQGWKGEGKEKGGREEKAKEGKEKEKGRGKGREKGEREAWLTISRATYFFSA